MTVNIDDMRDFHAALGALTDQKGEHQHARIEVMKDYTPVELPDMDSLIDLPPYQRQQIHLTAGNVLQHGEELYVILLSGMPSKVQYGVNRGPAEMFAKAMAVLEFEATRRMPARRKLALIRIAAALVLAGLFAYGCAAIGSAKTWPLLTVVAVTTAAAAWSIDSGSRDRIVTYLERRDGTILNLVSRAKLREDRANRHADRRARVWAAVFITPITVVITAIVTLVVGK